MSRTHATKNPKDTGRAERNGLGSIFHWDKPYTPDGKKMLYIPVTCGGCGKTRGIQYYYSLSERCTGICQTCKYISQGGIKSYQWKGGTITHAGYRLIHIKSLSESDRELAIPMARRQTKRSGIVIERYILEHRLVMARRLSRSLLRDEIVHHKNENKTDNRIKNLEILTKSEHAKKHWKLWKLNGGSPVEKRIENFNRHRSLQYG